MPDKRVDNKDNVTQPQVELERDFDAQRIVICKAKNPFQCVLISV